MIIKYLPAMLVGILFLIAGVGKLIITGVDVFSGMIEANYGMVWLTGMNALIMAWIVIVVEIVGGTVILVAKWVPRKIFKLIMVLLIGITLISIVVHGVNIIAIMKNLIIAGILLQLCTSNKCCN